MNKTTHTETKIITVSGHAGSGKTTELIKMFLEDGKYPKLIVLPEGVPTPSIMPKELGNEGEAAILYYYDNLSSILKSLQPKSVYLDLPDAYCIHLCLEQSVDLIVKTRMLKMNSKE